jgi:hypothetical protein
MSTISAGTTSGTALVSAGNTDGTLQLRVNGTTPSVTLAANGAIGVGSSPSYGNSGEVLTSSGTGSAPTWTTPSGGVTSIATSGGLTGGTITSTGTLSIDTNNSVGVGAYAFVFTVAGGSSVNNGSTTAGSNLNPAGTGNGSFGADTGVTLTGTWRNVSGRTAGGNGNGYGLFIRTA